MRSEPSELQANIAFKIADSCTFCPLIVLERIAALDRECRKRRDEAVDGTTVGAKLVSHLCSVVVALEAVAPQGVERWWDIGASEGPWEAPLGVCVPLVTQAASGFTCQRLVLCESDSSWHECVGVVNPHVGVGRRRRNGHVGWRSWRNWRRRYHVVVGVGVVEEWARFRNRQRWFWQGLLGRSLGERSQVDPRCRRHRGLAFGRGSPCQSISPNYCPFWQPKWALNRRQWVRVCPWSN